MSNDPGIPSLYDPIDTPKPVAEGVWVIDGPVIRMSFPMGLTVPFPTRCTVVRLSDGGLWVHSPIRLTGPLRDRVAALGEVEHLVSPNYIHYAGIPGWAEAFPDARAWASPGVRERAAKAGIPVHFHADLADEPDPAWAKDIDQHVFAGSQVMREVVFLHRPSRTLILTDLIENFETDRLAFPWNLLIRAAGACDPDGKAPLDMRSTFSDREAARRSRSRLLEWAPDRVILAHGRWYDTGGTRELERAFRWLG